MIKTLQPPNVIAKVKCQMKNLEAYWSNDAGCVSFSDGYDLDGCISRAIAGFINSGSMYAMLVRMGKLMHTSIRFVVQLDDRQRTVEKDS